MALAGAGDSLTFTDEPVTPVMLSAPHTEWPRAYIKVGKVVRLLSFRKEMPDCLLGLLRWADIGTFVHEDQPDYPGDPHWEEVKKAVAGYPHARTVEELNAPTKCKYAIALDNIVVKIEALLEPSEKGGPRTTAAVKVPSCSVVIYANVEDQAPYAGEVEGDIAPQKCVLRKLLDSSVFPSTPPRKPEGGGAPRGGAGGGNDAADSVKMEPFRPRKRKTRKQRKTRKMQRKTRKSQRR